MGRWWLGLGAAVLIAPGAASADCKKNCGQPAPARPAARPTVQARPAISSGTRPTQSSAGSMSGGLGAPRSFSNTVGQQRNFNATAASSRNFSASPGQPRTFGSTGERSFASGSSSEPARHFESNGGGAETADRHFGGGGEPGRHFGSSEAERRFGGGTEPERHFGSAEPEHHFGGDGDSERHFGSDHLARADGAHSFLYHGREIGVIHGDPYRWPRGYGYRHYVIGYRLPHVFWRHEYYVENYVDYGLDAPPDGFQWVRFGPDLFLVDMSSGQIAQAFYGAFG